MHAEHSAKGSLGSGDTAKRAIAIFERRTGEALSQVLAETAKIIEHRGTRWRKAMRAIRLALAAEVANARTLLEPSMRLARLPGESAEIAVDGLVVAAGDRLYAQLREFEDGWTAPSPKSWSQRHPALYAVMLLMLGSAIGALVSELVEAL